MMNREMIKGLSLLAKIETLGRKGWKALQIKAVHPFPKSLNVIRGYFWKTGV